MTRNHHPHPAFGHPLPRWERVGVRVMVSLACLAFFASKFAYANFEDLGAAARPLGMGNAFTALATDVNAIYYNPAGLAQVSVGEITTSYTRYLIGLSDNSVLGGGYMGGVLPLHDIIPLGLPWHPKGRHGVGVSYTNFHLFSAYQEHTIALGYGADIFPGIAFGLNVKGLFSSAVADAYTAIDPLFQQFGYSTWNIGVDAGVLWQALPNYRMALTVMNLNQPNMALSGTDRVPMIMKLGFAYRSFGLDVATDMAFQPSNNDMRFALGAEKWLAERTFGLRAGFVAGSREDRDLSAGMSYRAEQIQFDYAFVYPLTGLARTMGTHRLAFSVRFGQPPLESYEEFGVVPVVPKAMYDAEVAKANAVAELAKAEVDVLKAKLEEAAKEKEEVRSQKSEVSPEEQEKMKAELEVREAKYQDTLKELEQAQAKLAEIERLRLARLEEAKKAKEVAKVAPSPQPSPPRGSFVPSLANDAREDSRPTGGEGGKTMNPSPSMGEGKGEGGVPKTISVKEGDTLRSLAKKFYNDENKWTDIYRMNASQIRQGIVMPGQTLYLPGGK